MAGSFWLPEERDYRDLNPLEVGEEVRDTATKIDGGRVSIKD
jgi:hypothetical protein